VSRPPKAALGFLALFALVSFLVSSGTTHDLDIAVLRWFGAWRSPGLTTLMQFVSNLGNWKWEVPLVLLLGALLWRSGRRVSAWRYVALCVGGEALYALAKLCFHRERPTVISHLSDAGWYSYPSGHAMLAPIIWSVGLVLVLRLTAHRAARSTCLAFAFVIPLAIATSRVYLGVHYPTDVLGGLALGLCWVFLWWDAVRGARTAAAAQ
jgi:undecaprenyl-diphosphatase